MRTTFIAAVAAVLIGAGGFEPRITGISPGSPVVSPRAQVMTVTGEEFRPGLSLQVTTPAGEVGSHKGDEIRSQTSGSFQVSATFASAGRYEFVVINPDGTTSSPFPVEAKAVKGRLQPWVEQVVPTEVTKSAEAQVISLTGRNFATGLKVSITDPTGTVTVADTLEKVTPNSIVLRVMFEFTGRYELLVTNPSGESSNSVTVVVR